MDDYDGNDSPSPKPSSSPSLSPSPPPPPPPPHPLIRKPLEYDTLFTVPGEEIPECLPSPDDIEASTDIIQKLLARCTTRVGENYVAKFGVQVDPIEAENMRFARQRTTLVIPKVFAVYQRIVAPSTPITYIVMERMDGKTLQSLWDELAKPQKLDIARRLEEALASLRTIPHTGFFGSLGPSRLRDDMFWLKQPAPNVQGPFKTEEELVEALISKFELDCGPEMSHKAAFYRRVLPTALHGTGQPVFTHGDLQRKNIIVQPNGDVVIVDWAASGWYPSYWEYTVAMFACGQWKDDWHEYLAKILVDCPTQYIWLAILRTELWG